MALLNKTPGSVFYFMLDVGQGEGNLIIGPNNEVILFDLGSVRDTDTVRTAIVKYVHDVLLEVGQLRGLDDDEAIIDYVFISHSDRDHYNLFYDLYDTFDSQDETLTISKVYVGGKSDNYTEGNIGGFFAKYDPVEFIDKLFDDVGDPFLRFDYKPGVKKTAEFNIYILAANAVAKKDVPKNSSAEKVNGQSIVLMFEHVYDIDGELSRKVIIPADANQVVTDSIFKNYPKGAKRNFLKCDVMKLAHHGAIEHGCNNQNFLDALSPYIVFNSAFQAFGHPRAVALCRLNNTPRLIKKLFQHMFVTYREKNYQGLNYNNHPQEVVCDTVAIYCSYAWYTEITNLATTTKSAPPQNKKKRALSNPTAPTGKTIALEKKGKTSKALTKNLSTGGFGVGFMLETFPNGRIQITHTMTRAALDVDPGHKDIRAWMTTPRIDPSDPSTYGIYTADLCEDGPLEIYGTTDTVTLLSYAELCT